MFDESQKTRSKEKRKMKKTYKIEVDCANCANKMEDAAKNTAGVQNATVNFMTQKMIVEFEEGQDAKSVMKDVLKNCKKVEPKLQVYIITGSRKAMRKLMRMCRNFAILLLLMK